MKNFNQEKIVNLGHYPFFTKNVEVIKIVSSIPFSKLMEFLDARALRFYAVRTGDARVKNLIY